MDGGGLAEFLESLDDEKRLDRVAAPVDAQWEITEIVRRRAAQSDRPLLFESVRDRSTAVVVELWNAERICRRLGAETIDQLVARFDDEHDTRGGWADRLGFGKSNASSDLSRPKIVATAACQQTVRLDRDVHLGALPALTCGANEPHPSITAATAFAIDPTSSRLVVSCIDLRVVAPRILALDPRCRDPVIKLLDAYRERGENMPISFALGADVEFLLAGMAPVGSIDDPIAWASRLRGKPMEMIASRTSPILIPAWSEIVVEGIVDPSAPAIESGWFACFSGHYRESAAMTAVDVRAVTHRANPIMPAMVVAEGANEHQSLALMALRLTAARLITQISEVVAIVFPESSPAGSMAFISIEKRDPHQARRVASALWGDACLATAKLLLIVDADVDPQDEAAVWQAVAACADPERDVFFHRRADDGYDHAAEQFGSGTAMAIDATRKIAGEQTRRWPDSVKTPQSTRDQAAARWDEYGLPRDGDY